MSFWQQIVAFALRGLKPSYYWRHFVLGAIVPVIIIGLQIYACFSNSEISTGTAVIGILSYIAGALFLLILYPFSRFAYESIVEFVMGNNVIISNALLFLTYKYISYAILLCFSFVIAPIGMIILFFYNKHQFKLQNKINSEVIMKFLSAIFAICLLVNVSGCSIFNHQMGTRITDRQLQSITKGETTTDVLMTTFGAPDKTLNSGDDTMYVYNYEVIKSIGRNVHETVTFVCDKNGVVKDYIANRKAKSTGNALLKAAGY